MNTEQQTKNMFYLKCFIFVAFLVNYGKKYTHVHCEKSSVKQKKLIDIIS